MTSHKRTSVRRRGQRLSKEETSLAQEKFLKTFSTTANVRASCLAAGIDRGTAYSWLEHDEAFSFAYNQASADASDVVLGSLWQRAIQGVLEPVTSAGKVVRDDNGQP